MKPGRLFCYMLLFAFGDLTVHNIPSVFNSIPIILNLLANRNIALIYSLTICEQITKDCARSGSFQHIKLQPRCFQL